MSQGVGDTRVSEAETADERPAEDVSSKLWEEVRTDVGELFGESVEFTVAEYGDHVDVRVMPGDAIQDVEAEHDVRIVPYNALRMTIRMAE